MQKQLGVIGTFTDGKKQLAQEGTKKSQLQSCQVKYLLVRDRGWLVIPMQKGFLARLALSVDSGIPNINVYELYVMKMKSNVRTTRDPPSIIQLETH